MTNKTKLLMVGGLLALGAATPAIARAGGASETSISGVRLEEADEADSSPDPYAVDSEASIVGPDLDRASAVAMAYLGGGRVTGTEVGDEESYYEVEVTLDDSPVDVQLDQNFKVVGSERDLAGGDESNGG